MLKPDRNCTLCKLHNTANIVCLLGNGPKQSDIMIVGEAPGKKEDETGKPFVGQAGELLNETLEQYGFDRDDVYVCNAVSCRPPDNRTPSKGEVKACNTWLKKQIASVKPKFVLLLGNTALLSVTGSSGIKKRRGKPFEQDGITYLPTYHPAFILRDPNQRFMLEKDIKLFRDITEGGGIPREENLDYVIVRNRKQFNEMLDALVGHVSFDIETTCLYPWMRKHPDYKDSVDAKITAIGFGTKGRQWCLPVSHRESPWSMDALHDMMEEIGERLKDCIVTGHNAKFDFLWMWVIFGVRWYHYFDFDTMLAHYLHDENDFHGLKYLAQKYCGAPDWDIDGDNKRGNGPLEKLALYHAHDLYYTRELRDVLRKKLKEDPQVYQVFEEIMMPCARLFVEVEYDGVYIQVDKMDAAEKYLLNEVREAKREMNKFGRLENWRSPKQLGEFLFGPKNKYMNGGKTRCLGIPVLEKTKTGKPSTSESVIKRIEHPIGPALLKFRGAKQQLSFFIDGWKPYLHKNKLHPSFNFMAR